MVKYYLLLLSGGGIAPGICYSGNLPDGAVSCTQEQYENYQSWTITNGSIAAATPPSISLRDQASSVLSGWVLAQVNMASAMGETFTADMKAYVKALQAIANGTDTASTALPTQPTDVMEATTTTSASTATTTTATDSTTTTSAAS